jgi:beta-galactosidase
MHPLHFPTVLYGTAYYHEYMPTERLAEDVRMMKAAGLNFVRIGESTWSSWEPQDGEYETEWVDRVLDAMHEAGIQVMVGTPTYAVPPWLVRAHPDILVRTPQRQVEYGARQNMDIVHPVYREKAERIIRFVVGHTRGHPAVIGYQVDNETKSYQTAGIYAQQLFLERLIRKFGTPEALNRAWNLTYWSQRIASWDEFIISRDWTNPSALLEWRRFQQELAADFIAWQGRIVRSLCRPDQFTTQNFDFVFKGTQNNGPQPEVDHFAAASGVDIAGIDIYHDVQDGFDGTLIGFGGDWTRSLKQDNYLVLETNAMSKGGSTQQQPPYDGQLRQAVYAHLMHGANLVAYWPWHSIHGANEIYWRGVLGHDLEPNRAYAEVARTGEELARVGASLLGLKITSEVALLHSQDSYGALLDRPYSEASGYEDWMLSIYRALHARSVPVDFLGSVDPARLVDYKLVVVPALYVATDAELQALAAYVQAGGHVVLTFKSGLLNEHATVRPLRMPGALRGVAGVSYQDYSNISRIPLRHGYAGVAEEESVATNFAELLQVEDADVLATYEHPFFGNYPAVTRKETGTGALTYVGTELGAGLLRAVLADAAERAGVVLPGPAWEAPLHWRQGVNRAGHTVHSFFNFSGVARQVPVPPEAGGVDLLGGGRVQPGEEIMIGAWDLRLVEGRS